MNAQWKARAESAEVIELEPARPLRRQPRQSQPYPVDALGAVPARAVRGCESIVQLPVEMAAQSALACMSLVAQPLIDVELPHGKTSPTTLFLISIAGSGDRKTTADKLMGRAIYERERDLAQDYRRAHAEYENDKDAFEVARSQAKLQAKGSDRNAIAAALEGVGNEPRPPMEPTLSFPDPTLEGLQKYLATGQPSVAVFSDEGGQFVGGSGMKQENVLRTAAGFSKFWDGDPVKRLRAGDGKLVLYGRRVCMHLMLQPLAARSWLSSSVLSDQGFFSRLLIAAPPSIAGTRLYKAPEPTAHSSVNAFSDRITALLDRPYTYREGGDRELEPRIVGFDEQAKDMWRDFADAIEREMGPNGALRPIAGMANKTPEHAARLAAVLALFDNPDVEQLDVQALDRGIRLAKWYLEEALRLAEDGCVSDRIILAETLLNWMQNSWPDLAAPGNPRLISLPDIYQLGPSSIREQSVARDAVEVLRDHGHVVKVDGAHVIRGLKRREVYSIAGRL